MHVEGYTLLLFGLGGIILVVSWLPIALHRLPLSLPIVCMVIGFGLHATGLLPLDLRALDSSRITERLSEAVVLIALMGAGLKLDRPFGLRRWSSTWRLLAVAMPLTIVGVSLACHFGLGLPWAAALLLGAALSPTDPVLASDVQTGPPGKGEAGEVRFALTSEAGLNDGLAFPFVALAVALSSPGAVSQAHWFAVDFLGELLLGASIGGLGGLAMSAVMFRLPRLKLSDTGDGLVAVGVTLVTYATAQAVHANGFVAVFVCAAAIRRSAPDDAFHHAMSEFSEQIERVLVMLVLVLFGWGIAAGLLARLSWSDALIGLGLLILIRPAAVWAGYLGSSLPWEPKALIAFFGIRGVGTLYYLQFAFNRGHFSDKERIWAIAGFAIIVSVLLHGISSTPLMRAADRLRKRRRQDDRSVEAGGPDKALALPRPPWS